MTSVLEERLVALIKSKKTKIASLRREVNELVKTTDELERLLADSREPQQLKDLLGANAEEDS